MSTTMSIVTQQPERVGVRFGMLAHDRPETALVLAESEPGALPALPSVLDVPVLPAPSGLTHRKVTVAAGVRRGSVRLDSERLLRGAAGTITVSSRPGTPSAEDRTGTPPRTPVAGRD